MEKQKKKQESPIISMFHTKFDSPKMINVIAINSPINIFLFLYLCNKKVVEADKKPDIVNENEYCNIISDKEGVITKINVQNGTALIKVEIFLIFFSHLLYHNFQNMEPLLGNLF